MRTTCGLGRVSTQHGPLRGWLDWATDYCATWQESRACYLGEIDAIRMTGTWNPSYYDTLIKSGTGKIEGSGYTGTNINYGANAGP